MTGPEHYREAERLLDAATTAPQALAGLPPAMVERATREAIGAAQVHATLALAAATACASAEGLQPAEWTAWHEAGAW